MNNVVFRVDSSQTIGFGHLMRCLILAKGLRNKGVKVSFLTREHSGNFNNYIINQGFKIYFLPSSSYKKSLLKEYEKWLSTTQEIDANESINIIKNKEIDWLIVDHYAIDETWEKKLKPHVKKIMVIDDLANRKHFCNLLFDQTYGRSISAYRKLTPKKCEYLLGSENALLRPDFLELRQAAIDRRKNYQSLKHILISLGSLDTSNYTQLLLDIIELIEWKELPIVNIVLTSQSKNLNHLRQILTKYKYKVNLLVDVENMAELMLRSDLAIGSGGISSWERCCMGLPAILIILADNQKSIGENLSSAGATITLKDDINMGQNIKQSIEYLMQDRESYEKMSLNASKICDGNGLQRTVNKIFQNN
jgi:UDP-2,4-diacetamido-2,4,6-trideoxy-beta-L-altropyranose hydrolase